MKLELKFNYFVIAFIAVLTGLLGRFFTSMGYGWYQTLILPSFTPPGYVFSIAWSFIFFCTALSVGIIYNTFKRDQQFWFIIGLFLLNIIFNALWSFLFFYQHNIFAALIDACMIEATVLTLMVLIWPRLKIAAILLLPYFLWVGFAIFLNFSLLQLNH